MSAKESNSFKENFSILKQVTEKLQNAEEIDIDELIPLLDKAKKAYDECKDRLDAVEEMLKQRLKDDEE